MRKVSVAIATYNRAHIIAETLGYILGQTYPPTEIVVVDDGSTDETRDVITSLDKSIVYKRIENSGPGIALKTAIEATSNDWIALCDDDDRWRPDHLERRMALLDRFEDVDYTFSNFTSFGPDAKAGFDQFAAMPANWWSEFDAPDSDGFQRLGRGLLLKFLTKNPVFPTSVCFSRKLYQISGGIDPKFSRFGCWDAHFTWRCVLAGQVACDRHITVETRKHGGNFSRKRSRVMLERAAMLGAAWEDGWIPMAYEGAVSEAALASKIEALHWAWHEGDYAGMRRIWGELQSANVPRSLQWRAMLAYLPGWSLNLIRAKPRA